MSASNAADTPFSIRPRQITEPMASTVPKARASSGVILPLGIGRAEVRARLQHLDLGKLPPHAQHGVVGGTVVHHDHRSRELAEVRERAHQAGRAVP